MAVTKARGRLKVPAEFLGTVAALLNTPPPPKETAKRKTVNPKKGKKR